MKTEVVIADLLLDADLRRTVGWCPRSGEVARLDALDENERERERARWRAEGFVEVPRPDGLTEWRWRSDFVRLRVSSPPLKQRLGRMLRAGKGRWGFSRALALHPEARAAFRDYRRHQLIDYAQAWLKRQCPGTPAPPERLR